MYIPLIVNTPYILDKYIIINIDLQLTNLYLETDFLVASPKLWGKKDMIGLLFIGYLSHTLITIFKD